ncbi:unnamed protein product [Rhizophagus irregularis]|nr:unnamed protein product [Rhizophagus irregularis]
MANFRNFLNFNVWGMRSKYSYPPNGNNPLTPHVINTPAITPNGVNALNPSCGRSCPFPGNNPYIVDNSPHAVNDIYQDQKSSMMRDYHIPLQQQQQKRFYEVPVNSEYMGYTTNNYSPNNNNPIVPHAINVPAVIPNINGQILPPQISYLDTPQIYPNVCNSVNAFNSSCGSSCPLPGTNPFIVDNSPHAANDIYQDQKSSMMRDYHILLQQQQQKRFYEVPVISEYMGFTPTNNYSPNNNNPIVPHVINAPAVTPNINGQILPPQIRYLDIPQTSPNVCNGVNAFNSSCGSSCPLPGNNPYIVDNSPHAVNDIYQDQESSTMRDYHISQQKRVYELPEFPGNVGFKNHQFAQSMNIPQIEPSRQILASQYEISQESLNNYGSTVQSYVPDNNYVRQSSETTSLQNYQNYYSPSQQQQQTKTFEDPVFVGYEIPQNNCNNLNSF